MQAYVNELGRWTRTLRGPDEPTGALDSATSQEIIDLMLQLNREHGLTFVWVTHSEEVGAMAQRLVRMRDGVIVSDTGRAVELRIASRAD